MNPPRDPHMTRRRRRGQPALPAQPRLRTRRMLNPRPTPRVEHRQPTHKLRVHTVPRLLQRAQIIRQHRRRTSIHLRGSQPQQRTKHAHRIARRGKSHTSKLSKPTDKNGRRTSSARKVSGTRRLSAAMPPGLATTSHAADLFAEVRSRGADRENRSGDKDTRSRCGSGFGHGGVQRLDKCRHGHHAIGTEN